MKKKAIFKLEDHNFTPGVNVYRWWPSVKPEPKTIETWMESGDVVDHFRLMEQNGKYYLMMLMRYKDSKWNGFEVKNVEKLMGLEYSEVVKGWKSYLFDGERVF